MAATTTYTANPSGNSGDFGAAVTARGGTVVTNATFDTPTVGATVTTTGAVSSATGNGPGQSNTGSAITGEGANPTSAYLQVDAGSIFVDFLAPVFGAGLTTIDLFNPNGGNPVTFSAFTGAGGTGTLIGTATAGNFNLQRNNRYFLGIISDTANIGSVVFTSRGGNGDTLGVDNIVSAINATPGVPEPATWGLMIVGFGAMGLALRRREQVRVRFV